MKKLYTIVILIFGGILFYATLELPSRGPKSEVVAEEKDLKLRESPSEYYIDNVYAKTGSKNMVNGILLDFRSIDTLGEETVIFIAGIICFLLLSGNREDEL